MDSSYTVISLSFFQKKNFTQGHDKRGEKKLESASTLWYESFSLAFIRSIWEILILGSSETELVPKV